MNLKDLIESYAGIINRKARLETNIERTKEELKRTKPRSRRRVELETRLCNLRMAQLRKENRV